MPNLPLTDADLRARFERHFACIHEQRQGLGDCDTLQDVALADARAAALALVREIEQARGWQPMFFGGGRWVPHDPWLQEFAAAEQQPGQWAAERADFYTAYADTLKQEQQRTERAESALTTLHAGLEALEQEIRSIQLVAGQCSVEGTGVAASMAGAEAERCREWADRLAALRDGRGENR